MPTYYYKEDGKHRKRSLLIILSFMFLFPIVFALSYKYLGTPQVQKVFVNPVKQILGEFVSPINEMADRQLLGHGGDFGIYIKNLKTGEVYQHNADTEFDSASLYKLWVMEEVYNLVNAGKLSLNETISGDVDALSSALEINAPTPTPSVSPDEPKKPPVLISFKVSDALDQMITVSDNYAALLLVKRLGVKSITSFLKTNNFYSSTFESPPTTSAKDVGSFFELLYTNRFIDKDNSQSMIDLLKRQTINDRIPKYLPEETEAAHKTGELEEFKHDAGIVFSKKGDYIIVVLSKTDDPKATAENIANFSKEVFEYETR